MEKPWCLERPLDFLKLPLIKRVGGRSGSEESEADLRTLHHAELSHVYSYRDSSIHMIAPGMIHFPESGSSNPS
jgi:hypothetical protein